MAVTNHLKNPDALKYIQHELVLVATFGLLDKVRPNTKQVVEDLFIAGVTTRIVTGGHQETALHVARQAGIMPEGSKKMSISGEELERYLNNLMELDHKT